MAKYQMDIKFSSILIYYDNCIKTGDIFLLRKIKEEFSSKFNKYINMDILNLIDKDENNREIITKALKNIALMLW